MILKIYKRDRLAIKTLKAFINTVVDFLKVMTETFKWGVGVAKDMKENGGGSMLKGFATYPNLLTEVEHLSPRQFEFFVAELFKLQGYNAIVTPPTSDGGKDIILKDKYGAISFVECKRYSKDNCVGREICQKLLGAVYMCNAQEGIIVTTGKVHQNAYIVEQQVDNLRIIDGSGILEMMSKIHLERLNQIMFKVKNIAQ